MLVDAIPSCDRLQPRNEFGENAQKAIGVSINHIYMFRHNGELTDFCPGTGRVTPDWRAKSQVERLVRAANGAGQSGGLTQRQLAVRHREAVRTIEIRRGGTDLR